MRTLGGRSGAARTLLLVGLAFSIIPNGSVSPPYMYLGQIALGLTLIPALCLPIRRHETRLLVRIALILLGALSLYTGLQAVPQPPGGLAHATWATVGEIIAIPNGYLSINPWRSLDALPRMLLPALVFIGALLLSQEDKPAKRLWVQLSALGGVVLALSIILEAIFQDTMFFSAHPAGYGTFSGVFVNRNVAASFFSITAFALLGAIAIYRADRASGAKASNLAGFPHLALLMGLALFACVIAIVLTRSRAGSLLSLPLLSFGLVFVFIPPLDNARKRANPLMILGVMAGITTLFFLALFGEPVLSRVETAHEGGRQCAYIGSLEAIRDNPVLGTGLGTFRDIFPAYRDPECMGTRGSWLQAHNSFLEFYLAVGLLALIVLAVAYHFILRTAIGGLHRRGRLRPLPFIVLALLLFVSLHSMVDFPLQIPGVAHYFAALLGTGMGLSLTPVSHHRHPPRRRTRPRGDENRKSSRRKENPT